MAKAKQQDLPEVGDKKFPDLHNAAERYADVRDERMTLTEKEVALKAELLELMHKHKKTSYVCDGVEITIVNAEEKVKVKIHGKEEDEAA